jgi:hypothetical protein
MKRGEDTSYDGLVSWWKNHRIAASVVFMLVLIGSGITFYMKAEDFLGRFNSRAATIAEFNRLAQPVDFDERTTELAPGEAERFDKIVEEIKRIDPGKVILRSHSSRFNPAANIHLTDTRGEYVAGYMVEKGNSARADRRLLVRRPQQPRLGSGLRGARRDRAFRIAARGEPRTGRGRRRV